MRQRLFPILLLAGLMAAGAAAPALAERASPAQPEGGHGFGRLPWQSWIDPLPVQPHPTPDRRDRIVFAFDVPAGRVLQMDRELSKLCRRGLFNQLVNLRYRAFGPRERPLGVAYGRLGVNLYDPTHRHDETLVYFFKDQDTTNCSVLTARLDDLMRFYIGP